MTGKIKYKTQEMIAFIRNNTGATYKSVADKFDTSVEAIKNVCRRHNLKLTRPNEQLAKLVKEYMNKNPMARSSEIAEALGRHRGTVEYYMKKIKNGVKI